eukprot:2608907-Rhodomonas_salina.3
MTQSVTSCLAHRSVSMRTVACSLSHVMRAAEIARASLRMRPACTTGRAAGDSATVGFKLL